MKNSFTLFSTLILVFIFSILVINIFETKSINTINIINQYKYIQGKNHMLFMEEYIKSLETLSDINKLELKNKNYQILAFIKKEVVFYKIQIVVNAINSNIRLEKSFVINK